MWSSEQRSPRGGLAAPLIILLFAVTLIAVFRGPLFSGDDLWAPDTPFIQHHLRDLWTSLQGSWQPSQLGGPVAPSGLRPELLLAYVVSPRTFRYAAYMLNTTFIFLAAWYMLRVKEIRPSAAGIAALAMAFIGQTFSLIAAGHMGKFAMVAFALLTFAWLERAVVRRSLFFYALTGAAAGLGIAQQMDVMFMFCLLAGAYGVFKLWEQFPRGDWRLYAIRQAGGIALAAVVFIAVALPHLMSIFIMIVPQREGFTGQASENKWEFATNWSMPPEEMVEFLAPSIYGVETADPRVPYWGRLGRTLGWEKHRQGLRNLRQHTVYLGVIPIVFALYAVALALRRRNRRLRSEDQVGRSRRDRRVQRNAPFSSASPPSSPPSPLGGNASLSPPSPLGGEGWGEGYFPPSHRREILFWAGAWLVTVLLALGRYGPIYRLFFMLPVASSIRCPVKFSHLFEVSTVVLFAFGIDAFLARIASRQPDVASEVGRAVPARRGGAGLPAIARRATEGGPALPSGVPRSAGSRPRSKLGLPAILCLGGAAVFVIGTFAVVSRTASLSELWSFLGLGEYRDAFLGNMIGALMRAALFFLIAAALMEAGRRLAGRPRAAWLAPAIALAAALDMGTAAARYVKTADLFTIYRRNDLTNTLESLPTPMRLGLPVRDQLSERLPLEYLLRYHEIDYLSAPQSHHDQDYRDFAGLFRHNALRLWQLTACRYLFGITQALSGVAAQSPDLTPKAYFTLVRSGRNSVAFATTSDSRAPYMLIEFSRALPRAALYTQWISAPANEIEKHLVDPSWDPAQTVLVESDHEVGTHGDGPPVPVVFDAYAGGRAEIAVSVPAEAVLLLNDRYHPAWHVSVDGQPAKLLRCNGFMRGVRLGLGGHKVVMRYGSPFMWPAWLQVSSLVLVFCIMPLMRFLPVTAATRTRHPIA
ncbi:MAG: YfhO family protein [Planctomycetes bacterium]|nr:YfhO family protein [Planctomycetota bacterium]